MKPTIIDIMLAAELKKKKIRYHHRCALFRSWLLWSALVILLIFTPAVIISSILSQQYEFKLNPFLSIESKINSYYLSSSPDNSITLDSEAQLAKASSSGDKFKIFLSVWDTQIITRDNAKYAKASYRVYIDPQDQSRRCYSLTANMSSDDGGLHWQILSIGKTI